MSIRNGKVAYKSPIETIWSEIEHDYGEGFDQMVLTAVQCVGVRVNKEELVKALAYDRDQYQKGWSDRDADIVRCKDCIDCYQNQIFRNWYCERFGVEVQLDFYCAGAERRTDEDHT